MINTAGSRSSIFKEARSAIRNYYRQEEDGNASVLTCPLPLTSELFSNAAVHCQEETKQLVPITKEEIDAGAYEYVIWREAARYGLKCEKTYILPHSGFSRQSVEEVLKEDKRSGITSRIVVLSSIPTDIREIGAQGFSIYDDCVVISPHYNQTFSWHHPYEWAVSSRKEDVEKYNDLWKRLNEYSHAGFQHVSLTDLDEPLVLSADLINGVAPVLCSGDHIDTSNCAWYHGTWQYLRLLQMVSTPTWHHEFYSTHLFKEFAARKESRVLIPGTADYSMLAYVQAAGNRANTSLDLHVLDLCQTPLFACKWFAKKNGFNISTHQADILSANVMELGSFDIICTDAFLTRFSGDDRSKVIERLFSLLKADGKLITTIRMHSRSDSGRTDEDAVHDFTERALILAERWMPFIRKTPSMIAELADVYAKKMKSHVFGDEVQICSALNNAGFKILEKQSESVPGELFPTVYLRLILEGKHIS
jgi:hypothetical protein